MTQARTMEAELRTRVGKGSARAARRNGGVPAVIYGDGKDPVSIVFGQRELLIELKKPGFFTSLWDIKAGGETHRVLARDIQLAPINGMPIHVDFLRVNDNTRIKVDVPVHFINELASPGLKRGATLAVVRHRIELEVRAGNIPDSVTADLTGLNINDAIKVSMINLPDGAEPTIKDRDFTIAAIAAPSALKRALAEEAAAAASGGEGDGEKAA